ncbi:hypothetical protein NDU88_000793 [Pleurodeles waltl]|uniref:Uncharacterized protein n=1 Tax=Pleurodeles waltl TaxID=8319 RepID=A0AAV7MN18_PLEWA|nr:hypothetical protein NDU88_000793 [Pleurodeles waltl]
MKQPGTAQGQGAGRAPVNRGRERLGGCRSRQRAWWRPRPLDPINTHLYPKLSCYREGEVTPAGHLSRAAPRSRSPPFSSGFGCGCARQVQSSLSLEGGGLLFLLNDPRWVVAHTPEEASAALGLSLSRDLETSPEATKHSLVDRGWDGDSRITNLRGRKPENKRVMPSPYLG